MLEYGLDFDDFHEEELYSPTPSSSSAYSPTPSNASRAASRTYSSPREYALRDYANRNAGVVGLGLGVSASRTRSYASSAAAASPRSRTYSNGVEGTPRSTRSSPRDRSPRNTSSQELYVLYSPNRHDSQEHNLEQSPSDEEVDEHEGAGAEREVASAQGPISDTRSNDDERAERTGSGYDRDAGTSTWSADVSPREEITQLGADTKEEEEEEQQQQQQQQQQQEEQQQQQQQQQQQEGGAAAAAGGRSSGRE